MKKQIILTTLLLCGAISLSSAQGLFKVIASSGSNTKAGVKVKIGTQLLATDKITVGAKSYIGLSYAKGGTVQISTAGTYNAKDLETKLLATTKSSSQKYADFIIGEVTKSGDANIHKNPYAYQNVTGSVERKIETEGNPEIVVLLPEINVFIKDSYQISWLRTKGVKNYIVEIKNSFDAVLKTFSVQDTTCTIELGSPAFKEHEIFKISISTKDRTMKKINEYAFNRPEEDFIDAWTSFKKGLGENADNDAQKQLDKAVFLEENKLILDAQEAYQKAAKLDPESEIFKIAYNQFLIRHKVGIVDANITQNKE